MCQPHFGQYSPKPKKPFFKQERMYNCSKNASYLVWVIHESRQDYLDRIKQIKLPPLLTGRAPEGDVIKNRFRMYEFSSLATAVYFCFKDKEVKL